MLVRLGTGIKQGGPLSTSINPKSLWVGNAHDRTIESLLKRSFYSKNTHKIHSMARPWGWGKECLLWLQCHTICFTHSRTSLWHGNHYNNVIMGVIASQITSLTVVYSIVHSDADQRKHQSSASLAFVRGIHQWPVNGQLRGKCFHLMTSPWFLKTLQKHTASHPWEYGVCSVG